MRFWFWQSLIAIDQLFNALLAPILNFVFRVDGFGWADETLSSVFGKNSKTNRGCYYMCRLLHLFQKYHCQRSIEKDEGL